MAATVLVTGASSGIGAAIASLLHARGFTVFGTSRRGAGSPQGFPMLTLDVTSDASVRACVDDVLARVGRLDLLVNNAGYALEGAIEETSLAEAQAQFDTNFFGVVRMVKAVLPGMRKARAGKIVNIGSLAGLTAVPFSAFYCATKFALEGYSESLWFELQPFGIHVSLLEPGWVRSNITDASRTASTPLPEYDGPRNGAVAAIARAVEAGSSPDLVAHAVLHVAQSPAPRLRYRVGSDAQWLPRLRSVAPWNFYASGVRRTFALNQ
jgi:NAD(P)-dependent dehydrogenase (short-subunit alcohol dehydrogenase family)